MIKAVIAIGSNSTRLLVADCHAGALPGEVYRARRSTRLLMSVKNGEITQDGIAHAAQDVAELCAEARAHGAGDISLIATSATRDAKNSAVMGERFLRECGLSLNVLSGEEEARLAYLAVAGEGPCVVLDIGGGSTELTVGDQGKISFNESAQLGSSRLLLEFGEIRSLSSAMTVRDAARQRLKDMIGRAKAPTAALRGIGGTCVTAAKILTRDAGVEGVQLTRDEIERQIALLAPMTGDERALLPGLPASRASHMPHGLCILIEAMDALALRRLTVSEKTNMDGFLLDQSC